MKSERKARFLARLTYANVMATLAFFFALGGTAVAAGELITSNSQVARGTISGHKPPTGKHPNIIRGSLNGEDLAPGSVGTGKFAPGATAPNAAQLGGLPPSSFQRRVSNNCLGSGALQWDRAIAAIRSNGTVQCLGSTVIPIAEFPAAGEARSHILLAPCSVSCPELSVECHTAVGTRVAVHNFGPAGTLNWLYSSGDGGINASGNVIGTTLAQPFYFGDARLEGQFIFGDGAATTTINLHAFDGGDFCEVRGTSVYAEIP